MPTTIFTTTLTTDAAGFNGDCLRSRVPVTGASLGQVRVRFRSHSTNTYNAAHASIGKWDGNNIANHACTTAAVPIELKFSGVSGFSLAGGTSITSDWATLSFAGTDQPVVDVDTTSTGGSGIRFVDSITNAQSGILDPASGPGYNVTDPGLPSSGSGRVIGFDLIETQSSGASPMRYNSNLDGLGASGGFFRDPLARTMLGWLPGLIYPPRRKLVLAHG